MNTLRNELEKRNLSLQEATKLGVPYSNLQKQLKGIRSIGPKAAILYEEKLGIPKSTLRPDLWPPIEMKEEPAHEHS